MLDTKKLHLSWILGYPEDSQNEEKQKEFLDFVLHFLV